MANFSPLYTERLTLGWVVPSFWASNVSLNPSSVTAQKIIQAT
jgi:hypothetical protein